MGQPVPLPGTHTWGFTWREGELGHSGTSPSASGLLWEERGPVLSAAWRRRPPPPSSHCALALGDAEQGCSNCPPLTGRSQNRNKENESIGVPRRSEGTGVCRSFGSRDAGVCGSRTRFSQWLPRGGDREAEFPAGHCGHPTRAHLLESVRLPELLPSAGEGPKAWLPRAVGARARARRGPDVAGGLGSARRRVSGWTWPGRRVLPGALASGPWGVRRGCFP